MSDKRQVAPAGSDESELAAGCLAGVLGGVIGDAVGTAALLLFHPDWLFGQGDPIITIVSGLAIGWGVALVVAAIAGLALVSLMSAIARRRPMDGASQQMNVVLIFVVPAVIAAGTLWLAASVNR
jgi:hypothetical protein